MAGGSYNVLPVKAVCILNIREAGNVTVFGLIPMAIEKPALLEAKGY